MSHLKVLILSVVLIVLGSCISNKTISETTPTQTETNQAQTETNDQTPAEPDDFLAGLTKATAPNLEFAENKVVGDGIPLYKSTGERIQDKDMANVISETNLTPIAYLNNEKQIKAFVLTELTPQEINMRVILSRLATAKIENTKKMAGKKGKEAASFYVYDISGKAYTLEDLKGKIVVLNFWFIACKPCVKEIPDLNKLVEKYSDKDVVFIGLTHDKKEPLETFLGKTKFNYNIIAENTEVADLYEVSSYPTHFVIDKDSMIELALSGGSLNVLEQIDQAIASSLDR